jgi:hypothetical protein
VIASRPTSFQDWKDRILRLYALSRTYGYTPEQQRTIHDLMFRSGPLWEYGAQRGLSWGVSSRGDELLCGGADGQQLYPFADFREEWAPPVSQSSQSVTQPTDEKLANAGLSPDETLRFFEQDLRRDVPNLSNPHARNATVVARIHMKLRNAHRAIQGMTDSPSRVVASKFINYLTDTIRPLLEEQGQPFRSMNDLIVDLKGKLKKEVRV